MEEKQLDIHQPLLSVRHGSSTTIPPAVNKKKTNDSHPSLPSLPYYKSDLKSGPVRNPGVIPFQWEQSPGRPKNKNQAHKEYPLKEQLPPPKLPPGRIVNQKQQKPTYIELKDLPASSLRSYSETVLSSWELASWEKAISVLQEPDEEMKSEEISSSDDENVKLEYARDKFSRTDSFLLNCSAVASETPQFASRKHPVAREHLTQVKVATWRMWVPDVPLTSETLAHNVKAQGEEEDDDEDEARLCELSAEIRPGHRSDHIQIISSIRNVWTRAEYGGKDRFKDTMRFKKGSPQSFLCRENRFLSLPQESGDFRVGKLDLHKNDAEKISGPSYCATETTVYVDSEQMAESCSSNSSSSESRGRNPSVDYSLQDIKSLCEGDEKAAPRPKSSETADSNVFSTSRKSSQDVKKGDHNNKTQYASQSSRLWGKDMTKRQPVKPNPRGITPESSPPLGLAPLLPKSPSESWLLQTLMSMPPRFPSSKLLAGHMIFRPSPIDPKPDRMMKASIVKQHMLLRLPRVLSLL
ncbi:hypothetical protein Cgig2_013849 [Carnegiea gigantea]|uniref:Uncharacterized protein n=1 Tax=Carnegiea gigantea TaxID=171969 RepID=A0A9Q1QLM1_9CARY|nr:hypothetical protein Cgig2_013849 [Carnegiea gigantea]